MRQLYEIIYRTGGTERCTWRRVSGHFTAEEAANQEPQIERMGYKTLRYKVGVLDVVGMPEGWEHTPAK